MVCCCLCGHKIAGFLISKRQIAIQINLFQQKWFRINCLKMNAFSSHVVVTILTFFVFGFASGNHCKGCTPLDTLTFDKMLNHFRVSLVKIDVPYPYGEKQVHFHQLYLQNNSSETNIVRNLLWADKQIWFIVKQFCLRYYNCAYQGFG